jgi:hypothetical protein
MSDRSADGKELSRQKMEHTILFLMSLDESLDIGMDTRTGVDDSYQLPFKFTGTKQRTLEEEISDRLRTASFARLCGRRYGRRGFRRAHQYRNR